MGKVCANMFVHVLYIWCLCALLLQDLTCVQRETKRSGGDWVLKCQGECITGNYKR